MTNKRNLSNHKILFFLFISAFLIISCEKSIVKTQTIGDPSFVQVPVINEINAESVTIQWQTDMPCQSKIRYISDENNGMADTSEISDDEFRQNHSITVNNLYTHQKYHFRVISSNLNGIAVSSNLMSFTTEISTSACWFLFENGNFTEALNGFQSIHTENQEIFLGLGWTYLRMDSLSQSLQNFQLLYYQDYSNPDAIAGLSISSHLLDNQLDAINYGEMLYQTDTDTSAIDYDPLNNPFYIFEHDLSINNLDISIILAENYFKNFLFEETQQTLDILVPKNGLDSEDSTSWKIDDTIFESYEDALETYVDSLKIWFDFL